MSEQSQGPGWWQASDGKWYPPEQAPAPTAQQPAADPTAQQPAYGAPGYAAPAAGAPAYGAPAPAAAAAGGGGAGKIIAIVVVLALLAGGGAYLLTKSDGGGRSVSAFCGNVRSAQKDIKFEDVLNPAKVDAFASAFDSIAKSAPDEIKADMDTLNNAVQRERANVKAGKSPDDGFSATENAKLTTSSTNVEKFVKAKCGIDLGSGTDSSTGSFNTDSFTDSLSSQFSTFDTSSLSSELSSLCDQFGTEFGSEFCSSS